MKVRIPLLWVFFVLAVPLLGRANSIASIVVRSDGEILFSDYRGNRIWGVRPDGSLRVVLASHHTHHLALGPVGMVWGEHVTPGGSVASLWSLDRDGRRREILAPRRRPDPAAYEGTVFTAQGDELVFLRDCQIVRGRIERGFRAWAGRPCGGVAWTDHKVRYGHLHGSLAWGTDGTLYFSDSRTIRRISNDGAISTLDGRPTDLFAPPLAGESAFERLAGLALDDRGSLYVVERRDRTVRTIVGGREHVVARLPSSWVPIGLSLAKGSVYVLVEPRLPPLQPILGTERLLRISPSGKVETLARVR